jgi:hypothetical protein
MRECVHARSSVEEEAARRVLLLRLFAFCLLRSG